jgi:hypothetical protein
MNNDEANSPLGIASRHLAFAFIEQVAGKDWRDRDVTALQEGLYEYGNAIAAASAKSVERTS